MIKNYYDILEIKKNSSPDDIRQSYRKLSQRCHPALATGSKDVANHDFNNISEAFEVLSDPIKRAFYDKYGYQKLKQGFFAQGGLVGGYRFGGNAEQIYNNFFKEASSLIDHSISKQGSLFSHAFGGINHSLIHTCEDLIVQVHCTLSQLYTGCSKVSNYERKVNKLQTQVLSEDGRTTTFVNQSKLLNIKAGYSSQTTLEFPGEGHQTVHRTVSNLIFKIREIKHPKYSRSQANLIYLTDISLAEALSCPTLSIPTLDGRNLKICCDQIITYSIPKIDRKLQGKLRRRVFQLVKGAKNEEVFSFDSMQYFLCS